MEVHLNPKLEEKLNDLAAKTGRATGELVEDVITEYLNDLAVLRGLLDSRYDDLKSGRVKLIDGEDAFARLREKSKRRRDSST
jgi:predicted DNA-binding protein